jgi:hypothetical protein
MATRDITKEQEALKQFGSQMNKMPSTSEEWSILHGMAYGGVENVPEELKLQHPELYQPQVQTPQVTGLPQTPETSNIDQLRGGIDTAKDRVNALSKPNSAINALQEAIKIKTGSQNRGIGESSIFKAAGVGGIGALSQSLSATGNALQYDATTKNNIVQNMIGTYRDMANAASNNYNMAVQEYQYEAERLQSIIDRATAYENELNLIQKNNDAQKALLEYQSNLRMKEYGFEAGVTGGMIDPLTGKEYTVTGTAEQIAEAMKMVESRGSYDAAGESGEFGAYQFKPATWDIISQQYLNATGDAGGEMPMTPENQDEVVKWKVQDLLNKGFDAREIALIWNTSLGGKEQPYERAGVNDKNVAYDSVAHADKVMKALRGIVGETVDDSQPTPKERVIVQSFLKDLYPYNQKAQNDPANFKDFLSLYRSGQLDEALNEANMIKNIPNIDGVIKSAANNVAMLLKSNAARDAFRGNLYNKQAGGDINGVKEAIKITAKNNLNAGDETRLTGAETTIDLLDDIKNDMAEYEKLGGNTGLISGSIEGVAERVGRVYKGELAELGAKIGATLQIYRGSVTGKAFSEMESKEYRQIFPQIDKIGELNSIRINSLTKVLNTTIDNLYSSQMGKTEYETLFKNVSAGSDKENILENFLDDNL